MPEEKEYGYARDLADIEDPGRIPAEVTENALTYFKSDHFQVQDPENPTSDVQEINNHEMVIEVTPISVEAQIKAVYEEFDAAARQAVAEAINPPAEEEPAPDPDPNTPTT